jgi:hypothetical protein
MFWSYARGVRFFRLILNTSGTECLCTIHRLTDTQPTAVFSDEVRGIEVLMFNDAHSVVTRDAKMRQQEKQSGVILNSPNGEKTRNLQVRFEVFTAVTMKNGVF